MRIIPSVRIFGLALMLLGFTGGISAQKQPVDFVNPNHPFAQQFTSGLS